MRSCSRTSPVGEASRGLFFLARCVEVGMTLAWDILINLAYFHKH